ncbi:hypothetical protein [Fimbriimonas ginsengisoli]|uniref:Uncharacterized protein n=1 Tax=Fimbriimonas ginsengisoli Gsoil 348 TaxID=661478 RepID=A0A068NIK1_FIMGI|nr:hypothetical protein [Fimbriimonas ginsengisoli]AIE83433.1 hypothetical protein OP10G_0065 [Fimbriimonas ginsengisoli Gsoil 348]
MIGTKGQKVRTVDEACEFIREFLVYERTHRGELAVGKEHDFDLFLPWMMEIVVNSEEEDGSQLPTVLDRIYMDAAWELVVRGFLRPGPRHVSGDSSSDGYGKGYSLTTKGTEWIAELGS